MPRVAPWWGPSSWVEAPEFAVADGKGTVYVNMEDKNEVVAIDSRALTIKSRWPVAPAGRPTALAMDTKHRRLFSAGRNPQMLVAMDADSGKVIQSFPISAGVDAAAYEPETGMIFCSTREGMIHIFHEDSPDKFSEVETVKTEFGAKTMGLDTKTHNLFVDTADFGPPATSAQARPSSGPFRERSAFWFMADKDRQPQRPLRSRRADADRKGLFSVVSDSRLAVAEPLFVHDASG